MRDTLHQRLDGPSRPGRFTVITGTGEGAHMGRPAAGIRLGHLASDFLGDLERAGKSPHTIRGYRSDLAAFRRHYTGPPEDIDPGPLRGAHAHLRGYGSTRPASPRHSTGPPEDIDPGVLRAYLQPLADKSPATGARHEA